MAPVLNKTIQVVWLKIDLHFQVSLSMQQVVRILYPVSIELIEGTGHLRHL